MLKLTENPLSSVQWRRVPRFEHFKRVTFHKKHSLPVQCRRCSLHARGSIRFFLCYFNASLLQVLHFSGFTDSAEWYLNTVCWNEWVLCNLFDKNNVGFVLWLCCAAERKLIATTTTTFRTKQFRVSTRSAASLRKVFESHKIPSNYNPTPVNVDVRLLTADFIAGMRRYAVLLLASKIDNWAWGHCAISLQSSNRATDIVRSTGRAQKRTKAGTTDTTLCVCISPCIVVVYSLRRARATRSTMWSDAAEPK